MGVQKQCLLRVTDTHAKGFVITNPMLAKSKRRLCKHQLFVRKPTRYRTSELQGEAHFSPSRAVVSCDFLGAICKKEARFHTRFLDGTLTTNDTVSKEILVFIPSIGSQQKSSKRASCFEFLQKIFIVPLT